MLAIAVADAILAWLTVVVALAGALAAVGLLSQVIRPALEIKRYAEEIAETGDVIAANLEGASRLDRTRELAASLRRGTGGAG